jgi:peptidylamidoglycolate lyase
LNVRSLTFTAVFLGLAVALLLPWQARAAGDSYQYQQVENWAQLPADAKWGVMVGVGIDAKGNIYALQKDDEATKTSSKVMVFDSKGKFEKEWGEGEFPGAHSLRVYDGSVWIADRKLQQVLKLDTDGKVLLSLGQKGVAGDEASENAFNGVSDVAVAKNGDIFVSDGEGGNSRIVKFSKDGKFIKFWGAKGSDPGQFKTPHNIAIDSKGRVWVCDRGNKRLQVFDQDGKFLEQVTQFGTPHVFLISNDDVMYVAANAPENRITIGTTDGKILGTIDGLNDPSDLAIDATGAVYVSETADTIVRKYVKK